MARSRRRPLPGDSVDGRMIAQTLILVVLLIVALAFVGPPELGGTAAILTVLLAAPVWLVLVALHQAGHLVAARALGIRVLKVGVGPVMWMRTRSGHARVQRLRGQWGGGFVAVDPQTIGSRWRHASLMAGGPLVTGAVAVGLWVLAAWGRDDGAESGLTLLALLVTLLPLASLLRMAPRRLLRRSASGSAAAGEDANARRSGATVDATGWLNRYRLRLDEGETARAREALINVLERFPSLPRWEHANVHLEVAYFSATYDHDPGSAAESLEHASRAAGWQTESTRLRAEAALAFSEGRRSDARTKVAAARRALDRSPVLASAHDAARLAELSRLLLMQPSSTYEK